MAGQAPDLMSLLCLDPKFSQSPFGGNHRTILIQRDFTNSGDFVFNNLLQHFGRREPNTQILLITLGHDWLNYSACAAKCGFNLRRKQNMGNIEVFEVMERFLDDASEGLIGNYCDYILDQVNKFLDSSSDHLQSEGSDKNQKPIAVMIDDISLLSIIGVQHKDIVKLVSNIDHRLRQRSKSLLPGRLNYLIIQTMFTNMKAKQTHSPEDNNLNFINTTLENACDLNITLKPLETGHSTRVDGTVKIIDNRLPITAKSSGNMSTIRSPISVFPDSSAEIGSKKAFFYKLSDRRVRLTSSALIF